MADFGKYDKNGKGMDFEQFRSKLDSDEVKKNESLKKFFGIFDTENRNGVIDTDAERNSLFSKVKYYAGEDGILQDSEITEMLNSEPDMQALKDDKNVFDAVKNFFGGLNKPDEQELEKTVVNGIEIYKKDGRIVKKKNGDEITEYTYNKTENGEEYVTITTPTSTINVSQVEEDGTFIDENFINEIIKNENGEESIISKDSYGRIIKTDIKSETEATTTIYNTDSVYMYQNFKDLPQMKLGQISLKDGKQYFVYYDENGNTVTHTKNGDSVSRLTNKFDFENVEEFYTLNPAAKDKTLQVGQSVVVPNMLDATDERIIAQGDVYEELNEYSIEQFRTKNLQNISKETFNTLNKVKGFELNNENVMMYFKFNALNSETQQKVLDTIETLSKQGKTPDEIKEYFLQDENAPQEEVAEGVTRRINLFDGFTINLRAFDGESLKGDMSVKGFVEKELGLDIKEGEGKELYDALCNISDGYTVKDLEEMFSNIKYRTTAEYHKLYDYQEEEINSGKKHDNKLYQADLIMHRENKPLTETEAKEMYKAVIQKLTAPEGTVVNTKYDDFIENHKDSYLREFTADMVAMLHGQGAEILTSTGAQKDILQLGKYVLNPIADFYATKGKSIYTRMDYDSRVGNDVLTSSLEVYTQGINNNGIVPGVKYDKAKIKQCYDIFQNPNSTEAQKKKAMEDAFGTALVNTATELADTTNFIDGATDMALMLYGTGAISKVLTKGVAFATKGAKLTTSTARAIKGGKNAATLSERLLQVGTSATTFATWDSFRYTLNYFTNDIDESQLGENSYTYGEGLGKTAAHSAAFGAFAGAWGQLATSNLIKAVFKNSESTKVAQKAMSEVSNKLGKTSSFTSSQLLSTYQAAQAKAMQTFGKEALSFASETVGFSLYEIGSGALSGDIKIESMEDVGKVLAGQTKNLLSFKAMGKILFMHKNGQIPDSMMKLGKDKELKIENKNGVFEVKYPDGKVVTAKSMQEVVGLSNIYYENVTLYEPLNKILTVKKELDLGDGIIVKKGENGYVIELPDGNKVENKDLKVAMQEAQGEYQVYSLDSTLKSKGQVELPNTQTVTLKDNSYKTTTQSGKELEAGSLKDLLQLSQRTLLAENVEKAFEKQDTVQISNMVIQKSEDGSYKAMVVSAKGKMTIIEGNSAEEILTKYDETAKQQTDVKSQKEVNDSANEGTKSTYESPEVSVTEVKNGAVYATEQVEAKTENEPLSVRLGKANTREDFVAIRDEIKALPEGEERTQLIQEYRNKYAAWAASPERPDIRMEYKPDEATDGNTAEQLRSEAEQLEAKVKSQTPDITEQIRNMTDEEFETKKANVSKANLNIQHLLSKENILLAEKLCADKDFPKNLIADILSCTNEKNIAFAEKLCADKDFPKEKIADILSVIDEGNITLAEKLCADKDFPKWRCLDNLQRTNKENINAKLTIYEKLCTDKDFPKDQIANVLACTNEKNIAFAEKLCADKEFPKNLIANILRHTNEQNIAFAEKLCTLTKTLLNLKNNLGDNLFKPDDIEQLIDENCSWKDILKNSYGDIEEKYMSEFDAIVKENPDAEIILKVLSKITYYDNYNLNKCHTVHISALADLIKYITPKNTDKIVQSLSERDNSIYVGNLQGFIAGIVEQTVPESGKKFNPPERAFIANLIFKYPEKQAVLEKMLKNQDITEKQTVEILRSDKITAEDLENIDEYIKFAKEQGFDLVRLLESTEEEFNNYVANETERINLGLLPQPNQTFQITDNPKTLVEYLKKCEVRNNFAKVLKLSKEETKTISQILASENVMKRVTGDNLDSVIEDFKNTKSEDIELVRQGLEVLLSEYRGNTVKSFLAVANESALKREAVTIMFECIKNYQRSSGNDSSLFDYTASEYMLKMVKSIDSPEQLEAYKYYIYNVKLKETDLCEHIPDFTELKSVIDVKDFLNIQKYKCSHSFRNAYLQLPAEDRALFTSKYLEEAARYRNSSYNPCLDIAKLLLDPKLDETIKNDIREFMRIPQDKNSYIWGHCYQNNNGTAVFIPENLKRLIKFEKSGTPLFRNGQFDYYIADYFDGKFDNEGTFRHKNSNEDFDRTIEMLNKQGIKDKLGRPLTTEEAQRLAYLPKQKMDFVMQKLSKDMKEDDILRLYNTVIQVKTEEQYPLVDIALKYNEKIPTKDGEIVAWNNGYYYSPFEHLTTKEEIDAFCKIFKRSDYTANEARFLLDLVRKNENNFVFKYDAFNRTEKIKANMDFELYKSCIEHIKNEYQVKFLEEIGDFAEEHPEFREHLTSLMCRSYETNEYLIDSINSKEVLNKISDNLKQLGQSDCKYISEIIFKEKVSPDDKTFMDLILSNFSDEKVDFIKDFKTDGYYQDKSDLVKILCSKADIKLLELIKLKATYLNDISSVAIRIDEENTELAELLLKDERFNLIDVCDSLHATGDRYSENKELAKQLYVAKVEFYESFKDNAYLSEYFKDILLEIDEQNITLVEKLCADKEFPKEHIAGIIQGTNEQNITLAEKLCADKEFPKEYIRLLLIPDCPDLTLERLKNPQFKKDVIDICKSGGYLSELFIQAYGLQGKKLIAELSKTEKREFVEILLANKNTLCSKNGLTNSAKEKIPLLPSNTEEYAQIMKKLANSLNIAITPVSAEQVAKFNQVADKFSHYLQGADLSSLTEVSLTMSHAEFISKVQDIIKHLPLEEQTKIQDFYGFKIIDGKLCGYPNNADKNISLSEITDEKSIIAMNKLSNVIDDYVNNNFITVKDNPQLNQQLKELSSVLPEIFNQADGSNTLAVMIKQLQNIVKKPEFEKLSDSDKKVMLISTLLHQTDKTSDNVKESAFDAYFTAKKFNMTNEEANKVYSIIEASNFVEDFINTHKRPTVVNIRAKIVGQEREDKFDLMAFKLKEGNNYELAQMLYSSKYEDGFTRYFDKLLTNRIQQIKATDFILPQTPSETYLEQAKQTTLTRGNENYDVKVVEAQDIEDFYAYIHTPEASFATGGTRGANFANFDSFAVLNDDKVICTSYVGNDLAGLVKEFHHGFIFDVQNDKQYVGYGTDIFSLAKNIPNMIVEYYRDRGFQANRGRGAKYGHRSMISNALKALLYGKDYYSMANYVDKEATIIGQKYEVQIADLKVKRDEYLCNKFGTDNITKEQYKIISNDAEYIKIVNQMDMLSKQKAEEIKNIKGYSELKEMDKLYAQRLDELKNKLGTQTMTLENIEKIDSEFAKAYREFLKRNGSDNNGVVSLLRSGWHNEVLVSNPKISAIFTDSIDSLPTEYLVKAQEENLPIVVIK